jgi:transposase
LVEPGDGELSQTGDGNLCFAQLRGRIVARTRSSTHHQGTFKLSTDPDFEEKVIDVVALYLDPPMDAVVLSIDEKTQIQALDRTQPLLPMTFSKTEKRTHDYTRHGTTNLFAALNTATGDVVGHCFARRRTKEFLKFMNQVVAAHDRREIHVVLDNLSTHSGSDVDKWLSSHPNVTFHFTPTGSSWLNQVEIWFGIITKQAIRRGTFRSLRQLISTINTYITNWNHDSKTIHLDCDSERDRYQGSPDSPGLQKAARQQRQLTVKTYLLRDTSRASAA